MSFFFQAEDGIRDYKVTGVQTCALPISSAFAVIAPGDASVGVAVRCPSCAAVSVNLVSRQHVDIPFWNDARVGRSEERRVGKEGRVQREPERHKTEGKKDERSMEEDGAE